MHVCVCIQIHTHTHSHQLPPLMSAHMCVHFVIFDAFKITLSLPPSKESKRNALIICVFISISAQLFFFFFWFSFHHHQHEHKTSLPYAIAQINNHQMIRNRTIMPCFRWWLFSIGFYLFAYLLLLLRRFWFFANLHEALMLYGSFIYSDIIRLNENEITQKK